MGQVPGLRMGHVPGLRMGHVPGLRMGDVPVAAWCSGSCRPRLPP